MVAAGGVIGSLCVKGLRLWLSGWRFHFYGLCFFSGLEDCSVLRLRFGSPPVRSLGWRDLRLVRWGRGWDTQFPRWACGLFADPYFSGSLVCPGIGSHWSPQLLLIIELISGWEGLRGRSMLVISSVCVGRGFAFPPGCVAVGTALLLVRGCWQDRGPDP